ncbi:MAG: hypothetical protein AB1656_04330 [Candidatus Omnitrophota bacterium]
MFALLEYLPYLAAPFMFPGIAAALRLFAFLALAAFFIWRHYPWFKGETAAPRFGSSPWALVLLIGATLPVFAAIDPWPRHLNWPVMASGSFLILALSVSKASPLRGLGLTTAILWVILFLHLQYRILLPSETFSDAVLRAYPTAAESKDLGEFPTIAVPPPSSALILFHAALALTAAWLFACARSAPYRFLRIGGYLLIFIASLALIRFLGDRMLPLIGANFLLFYLLTSRKERFRRWSGYWPILFCVGVCAAVYSDILPSLQTNLRRCHICPDLPWNSLRHLQLFGKAPHSVELMGGEAPLAGWLLLLPLAAVGFCLLYNQAIRRSRQDSILPAALAIFLAVAVYVLPSPLAFASHPAVWLALGVSLSTCLRFQETEALKERPFHRFAPQALTIAAAVAALPALFFLLFSAKAEYHLRRFDSALISSERLVQAEAAYRSAPSRADAAALYAVSLTYFIEDAKKLPAEELQQRMETALNRCARFGYIPLLAYKRLSELYPPQSGQSIQILQTAAQRYPHQLVILELLAGKLAKANHKPEAVEAYRQCVNLDPTAPRLRKKLLQLYQDLGWKDEYQREEEHLLTLDPTKMINQ